MEASLILKQSTSEKQLLCVCGERKQPSRAATSLHQLAKAAVALLDKGTELPVQISPLLDLTRWLQAPHTLHPPCLRHGDKDIDLPYKDDSKIIHMKHFECLKEK